MRALVAVAVSALVAAVAPAAASAYDWPLRPFRAMHAIRGGFDDPRYHVDPGVRETSFHFGVDIVAQDLAPVYAVAAGRAVIAAGHVAVQTGTREFGYWHVLPAVSTGQRIRLHQLVGVVGTGWGHLHFAESQGGVYVNPLRPRALSPYVDRTRPVVASVAAVSPDGVRLDPRHVSGTIGIVAEAYDTPPLAPPPPWQDARLVPAQLRWRLVRGGEELEYWRTTADLGVSLLPERLYDLVYAPGTYQNRANRPGRYVFWLDRELDTRRLEPGTYEVEVQASDAAGNRGSGTLELTVARG